MAMLYYKVTTRDDELLAVGKDRSRGMIHYEQGGFIMSKALDDWISKELGKDTYFWRWDFIDQIEFETYEAFGIMVIE